jgi:hypothetical protein
MSTTLRRNMDIWTGPERHIAFAVNAEGVMSGGFTDQVRRCWPEIAQFGKQPMGTTRSQAVLVSKGTADGRANATEKRLHALVCRTSRDLSMTPEVITACLDSLPVPVGMPIAVLLPGAGQIGRSQGADVNAIYDAIARSKMVCVVYTYSRELDRA